MIEKKKCLQFHQSISTDDSPLTYGFLGQLTTKGKEEIERKDSEEREERKEFLRLPFGQSAIPLMMIMVRVDVH